MGINLISSLSEELANLGKDAETTKSAMKALKLYLEDLDSTAIPDFLAKVSETDNSESSFGEYTISLYEVLARVHGPKIVSYLDDMMSTIIKTLTTSGGLIPIQQACSKVVPAIARYGVEPTMSEDKKRHIVNSLCKPLSDSLLSSQEGLSCGSSLCLKALVDCDNWRFASSEMVNKVCLNLAGALKDTSTQTNSHMGLVMSLAKKNSFVVEAYARLLINAGLHILNCGLTESNSQKRLTAIQMVHSLMTSLDIRSILSELEMIIDDMEKCQFDEIPYVKGAAFEALQTAKKLLSDKGSQVTDFDVVSVTGSSFGGNGNSQRRHSSSSDSRSPISGSSNSQNLDSFAIYESYMDSPISTCQSSCNGSHSRINVDVKLSRGNGCVDRSLEDGIFSKLACEGCNSHVSSEHEENSDTRKGYNGGQRSRTPSPERTSSEMDICDDDDYSDLFEDRLICDDDDELGSLNQDWIEDMSGDICDICEEFVSPTEEVTITDAGSHNKLLGGKNHSRQVVMNVRWTIADFFILISLVVLFALLLSSGNQDRGNTLVPT